MNDFLDKLAAGPLANPSKIFLPEGRRKGDRKRSPAELEDFRADRLAKKERLASEAAENMRKLFAYYAGTDVPLDRVAAHLGIDEDRARAGLAEHGRQL
jgi:hypothetical protein